MGWRRTGNKLLNYLGGDPPTCGKSGPSGPSWLKPPAWRAGQSQSLRPGPEAPGVDAASSLRNLNSMTDQDDLPGRGRSGVPHEGDSRPALSFGGEV